MTITQPQASRATRAREGARPAILAAAGALLAEEGAESLSMRRLAERSGYTVPTISTHFGDKLGLVEAVLAEVFAELVRELEGLPRGDDRCTVLL